MLNLPPLPPPYSVVRHADASVVRALQAQARASATPSGQHRALRSNTQRLQRQAAEQRRRELTAQMRNRTRTSQRY